MSISTCLTTTMGITEQGVLLREEVSQLQEEVQWLRQMKEMLTKELEESHGGKSAEVLSATELKVQLAQKEDELARAKEALQAMKTDRKRLKAEKADLVNQMQQLYATLESREEQLRDFIRNYEQHRKESEDAVKLLAKEKDSLEREKWELRRQTKDATDHATTLRTQLDLKENRIKELEAELAMIMNRMGQKMEYRIFDRSAEKDPYPRVPAAKQSLATLTKDVPKRHSLAMPSESMLNGNQEWVMHSELPLTAAIRQSQQTLYHAHQHSGDRQGKHSSRFVLKLNDRFISWPDQEKLPLLSNNVTRSNIPLNRHTGRWVLMPHPKNSTSDKAALSQHCAGVSF
ncbi:kazrin isoform X5 [Callorhinchus milii]|uniref:kazrin isoform X5 n=1 Tax=Callorhinchus milii TaxID=7868 RepID=UPI001C3FB6EC|nr:kazrin isoform X5 [Callorhinchus milii]